MNQKYLRNLPLDGFQHLIRNGQVSESAVLFGKFRLAVMLAQIVADGIKRLGVDAEVSFKGGKLPVYDHETSLPLTVWNNTMMYGEVRSSIRGAGT